MSSCISGGLFGKDWCWGNVYRINVSIYESTRHLKRIDCYRDMGRTCLLVFSFCKKKIGFGRRFWEGETSGFLLESTILGRTALFAVSFALFANVFKIGSEKRLLIVEMSDFPIKITIFVPICTYRFGLISI